MSCGGEQEWRPPARAVHPFLPMNDDDDASCVHTATASLCLLNGLRGALFSYISASRARERGHCARFTSQEYRLFACQLASVVFSTTQHVFHGKLRIVLLSRLLIHTLVAKRPPSFLPT